MNKYMEVAVFLALCPAAVAQAQNIDSLFVNAPASELQLLERNPRLDMLDLYNYKMTAKGENIFGGYSVMESKTNDHIAVKLTDASTWEMVLLPAEKGDTLISCIHTVASPAADSEITFYHRDWTKARGFVPATPPLKAFLVSRDSIPADSVDTVAVNSLMAKISVPHIKMRWILSPGSPARLEYAVSTALLGQEDNRTARFCLKPVVCPWPFKADGVKSEGGDGNAVQWGRNIF